MEYNVDKEGVVYGNNMEYVDGCESQSSDDLSLARGIFNGFIIQLFAAIFIFAIVAVI